MSHIKADLPMARLSHDPVGQTTIYRAKNKDPVIEIGRFSYACGIRYGFAYEQQKIKIGSFTSIADEVYFFHETNHNTEWHTNYPVDQIPWPEGIAKPKSPYMLQPDRIEVGNDVWLGHSSRILPGRVIGDGAVVGTATIVTRDVRPYAVYVGNPGVEVKRRFDDKTVDFLIESRWWDLPIEVIRQLSPLLCSSDTEALKKAINSVL